MISLDPKRHNLILGLSIRNVLLAILLSALYPVVKAQSWGKENQQKIESIENGNSDELKVKVHILLVPEESILEEEVVPSTEALFLQTTAKTKYKSLDSSEQNPAKLVAKEQTILSSSKGSKSLKDSVEGFILINGRVYFITKNNLIEILTNKKYKELLVQSNGRVKRLDGSSFFLKEGAFMNTK